MGSRLQSVSSSKPLAKVCGLSLLEVAARQLAQAGARRVVVVTGYRAAAVEATMPEIGRAAGLHIDVDRLDNWTLPTCLTVVAGAGQTHGEYQTGRASGKEKVG